MPSSAERIVVVGGSVSEDLSSTRARVMLHRHGLGAGARAVLLCVVVEVVVGGGHLLWGLPVGVGLASGLTAGAVVGLVLWWRSRQV